MNDDWDSVGFVLSSRYRVAVLRRLAEGPASPSMIASDADLPMSHISRAIGELREESLVELLVPEERKKGRIYGISEQGSEVWGHMESEDMV